MLYLAEMREQIKKDNPGISITEITKKAGEMWKEVSDKSVSLYLFSLSINSRIKFKVNKNFFIFNIFF